MMIGRCCRCREVKPVTIKGFTASTGVTQWEYGPGSLWALHYGADEVTGIVFDADLTPNRFLQQATAGYFIGVEARPISGAYAANAAESLTLTKLNSTDGTVIESALMAGVFTDSNSRADSWHFFGGSRQTEDFLTPFPVGLSGGDYLLPGSIDPIVEWIDYTTNTANKEYKLHAHTLHGGNVYFRTKTSSEVITVPHNATAGIIKAAFEATADCVSATATGGPWPLAAINLDITWSQATGDIGALKFDSTYTAGGAGTCTFQWNAGTSTWVLVSDSCDPGPAEEPTTSGTYDGELRAGTCPVSFPPKPTATRRTRSVAITWDTGTGLISSTIGYRFGMGNNSAPSKLISETAGTVPSYSGLPQSRVWADSFVAGAGNSVMVVGEGPDPARARTVEAWTVAPTWSRIWQRYANGDLWSYRYAFAERFSTSGKVSISVPRRLYNTTEKCGTIADIVGGTFTAFDEPEISTSTLYANNAAVSNLMDGSSTNLVFTWYDRSFDAGGRGGVINYNLGGSQFKTPSKRLLIGSGFVFGYDADRIYTHAPLNGFGWKTQAPPTNGTAFAGSMSRTYRWQFYSLPWARAADGEWRFTFKYRNGSVSGFPNKATAWLDWQCTAADIKTAILAVFPENTEGVVSNVRVNPFGASNVTDNVPAINLLEANLDLHLNGVGSLNNPFGFIPAEYLGSGVAIETRNGTVFASGNMVAYSATDASVSWSRNFGTKSTTTTGAIGGWKRGTWLIAYGDLSDNEL